VEVKRRAERREEEERERETEEVGLRENAKTKIQPGYANASGRRRVGDGFLLYSAPFGRYGHYRHSPRSGQNTLAIAGPVLIG
jgi:hypothetical protein